LRADRPDPDASSTTVAHLVIGSLERRTTAAEAPTRLVCLCGEGFVIMTIAVHAGSMTPARLADP
jgi:hypothetical protein